MLSIAILPVLRTYKIKLPIIEPSDKFMKTIISKIEHEQIISLSIKANQFERAMQLASSNTFTNVKSLTLENFQKPMEIYDIKRYIPSPTCLSVRYDQQADFHNICKIFNLIPYSIKLLQIYCDFIRCSHHRIDLLFARVDNFNFSVESFVLNVDHTSKSIVNMCAQYHTKCVLRTITDFIQIMSNIRYVRIIVKTKGNPDTLLDVNEWMNLVNMCKQLKKITLQVINKPEDTQLQQKIEEIKNALNNNIIFKVKVK